MQAVILAGGKGTRLKEITQLVPKPMVEVAGKPLLQYQVELCKQYDLSEIIILVNHLKESIIDYFGDGNKFGIPISYFEEPKPLGTVGGIKEIEHLIKGDFLVLYGDVMMRMDVERLVDFHFQKNSECTLVLHPNDHPNDSDLVEINKEHKVIKFHPKPHDDNRYYTNLVNAGAYVFSKRIFNFIEKGVKADFGREVFPNIYNQIKMFGYNTTEYLKDMGTPDRLGVVEADVISGKVANKSFEFKQKAIILDRDGVINPDYNLISTPDKFELYPYTADAIKKINQSEYQCFVATNQSVVARNMATEDDLKVIHNKMDTLLGKENAKIDAIYYCPHHPDAGFPGENKALKIICDCRKPKPGMLLNAARDFNTDLSQSYFVGDSERDIMAGKAAGVATIGLKTGHGLKSAKVLPDYFLENLKEAVDFIIDDPLKSVAKRIESKLDFTKKQQIISIAGNSRSGKSTLTSYLAKRFRAAKKEVFQINLDDWILAKSDRPKNATVLDNFQFDKMIEDLDAILQGKEITAIGYARHPNREVVPVKYRYNGEQIILIDGIVSLANDQIRDFADLKVFKTISQSELVSRVSDYYKWKGFNQQYIENLIADRTNVEYKTVESYQKFADLVL